MNSPVTAFGMPLHKARAYLANENSKWPIHLRAIPRTQWPKGSRSYERLVNALRSRFFLVQVFDEGNGILRISINRSALQSNGRFEDAITWDELQQVKAEAGFGDRFAVEVFPATADYVNVANMRHLWVLPERPAWAWARPEQAPTAQAEHCEAPVDG